MGKKSGLVISTSKPEFEVVFGLEVVESDACRLYSSWFCSLTIKKVESTFVDCKPRRRTIVGDIMPMHIADRQQMKIGVMYFRTKFQYVLHKY